MARSRHSVLTAADRFDRRKGRQGRPSAHFARLGTRSAVLALAIREG